MYVFLNAQWMLFIYVETLFYKKLFEQLVLFKYPTSQMYEPGEGVNHMTHNAKSIMLKVLLVLYATTADWVGEIAYPLNMPENSLFPLNLLKAL